ncbi:MAG: tetratricopeptide repeat protein [Deltaproteobacteria bacterium]|nr:tetratricopeptide repeat protein [Deltaproteobacteria bacterium]
MLLLMAAIPSAAVNDEETLLAGEIRSHFEVGRMDAGRKALDRFRARFPTSAYLPELALVEARAERNPYEALRLYERFLETYEKNPSAPAALLDMAELQFVTGNVNFAMRDAKRLVDRFPGAAESEKARYLLARSAEVLGRSAEAANEYASLVALDRRRV